MTEPIAFYDPHKGFYWAKPTKIIAPVTVDVGPLPLYTQRTWVGLTDEDFLEACQIAERGNYLVAFQRIQAALKAKNT